MRHTKLIIAGLVIVLAIIYLIVSSTQATAQYFLTVDEVIVKGSTITGKDIRLSGAVVGDTIQYDPHALTLTFSIAHVPGDNKEINEQGGLAKVLHDAVIDPDRTRLHVVYHGPKPDLLRDEAQAIITGSLDETGVFQAQELLLKCPTKYEEALPQQSSAQGK